MEKVSIIVPIFNAEKYIKKLLLSILNQTYNNFELILVDDGSTDNSIKIVKNFKDKRIKIIRNKNNGVSSARNIGIENATGKYITFFDADDYIEINYLQEVILLFNKYLVDLVITGYFSETANERNSNFKFFCKDKFYENKKHIKEDLILLYDKSILYNVWNKIYKKSIINKYNIKFKNIKFGEDVEFNKDYLKHINKMYNTSKCYYHYVREIKNSATNKYINNLFEIRLNEYKKFIEYFKEEWNIPEEKYKEFISRHYLERSLGCIQNLFNKDCKKSFFEKYMYVKNIINHEITRKTLKIIIPKSKKIKILLISYKLKLILITILEINLISFIKNRFPKLFNKLKNER